MCGKETIAFGADVTLTGEGVLAGKLTLKTANIAGAVTGGTFAVAGRVNSFTARTFVDSAFLAGFVPTNLTGPFGGGIFTPGGKVNAFRVVGVKGSADPAFSNSSVAAGLLGTVSLKSIGADNRGRKYGLLVEDGLTRLKVTSPALALKGVIADPVLSDLFGEFELRVS